ncbi:hypothetical protein L9F63_011688 [Diploptera punctata]|uniref:FYVE-type domain-containing protein n=1 Tax=Diploptera punctata TaxID=6984 RepID=A0AAD8AFQ3_DIPPU|nr:hypothetical protein L9F63_011688 [Diploptera punctata]
MESFVELNKILETALATNAISLTEATGKVNELNQLIEEYKMKLNAVETKNIHMERRAEEKEMEMNKIHADLSNLETRLSDSLSEVKQLQAELHTERSNNVKLQEERNAATNEVTKLENILTQKEKNIAVLKTQKLEVQKNLEDCNNQIQIIKEEGEKDMELYKTLLNESKMDIDKCEKEKEALINENQKLAENVKHLEESLSKASEKIKEKDEHLSEESADKEAIAKELALERNKCAQLEREKLSSESNVCKKSEELKKIQASLDEVAGEKLALEAQLAASQSEQQTLLERCFASSAESENQRKNNADLRRKLEESQAALHELGRENQTLQLELEKLVGRKWTEDSDAVNCTLCQKEFSIIVRRHHCRNCGQIFCNECSSKWLLFKPTKSLFEYVIRVIMNW